MRNQELGLDGIVCLEMTAAVAEQVVHEQTVWTLLEACLEDLGDRDHLVDRKKMALHEGCQQMLQHLVM